MVLKNDGKAAIIIVIVLLLVICSVAGVAVFKLKGDKHTKDKTPKGPTAMITIGDMIVNLADTSEMRYAKANIVLEVCGKIEASGGEGGEESSANAPLRDAIISTISSKQLDDLSRPNGKDALKTEIMAACNKRLKEAKVTNVYFNEFAMQ